MRHKGIGFVFPGVILDNIDTTPVEGDEIISDPKMTIGPISSKGIMVIDFDQEMIAPPIIDPKVYETIFEFSLKLENEEEPTYGKFTSEKENSTKRLL